MHPIAALTLLFGPLAKYTATRGAPLPDGSPLQRGLTPATQDPRDADKVAEAGRYSSALHRLGQQPGGSTMAAALEEWFTRMGIEHHGKRLIAAVEALEKRGVRLAGAREPTKVKVRHRSGQPVIGTWGPLVFNEEPVSEPVALPVALEAVHESPDQLEIVGLNGKPLRARAPKAPSQARLRRYEALLSTAIAAYGACLDGA